mmetsp:Transcript_51152/g.91911  ORF Transcript_51152/g.91911 Transcript_51152/m.91911 type:complete len:395 (-) Transcript_51152:96-1280(-)
MKPAAPPPSPSHGKNPGVTSPLSFRPSSPHHFSARQTPTAGTLDTAANRRRRPFTAPRLNRAQILADLAPALGHAGPAGLHVTPLRGVRGKGGAAPGSLQPSGPLGVRTSSPRSVGWDSFGETTLLELVGCSFADDRENTSLLCQPDDSTLSNWPALPGSAKPIEPLVGQLGGRKPSKRRPESAPCISALVQPRGLMRSASDVQGASRNRELAPSVKVPDSWEFVREAKLEEELLVQISRPKSAQNAETKREEKKEEPQVSFSEEATQQGEAIETQEEYVEGDRLQEVIGQEAVLPQEEDNLTALQATMATVLATSFQGGKQRVLRQSASAGSLPRRRYDRRYSRYARKLPFVLREPFPDAPSDQLTSNICNIDGLLAGRRAAWSKTGLVDETH